MRVWVAVIYREDHEDVRVYDHEITEAEIMADDPLIDPDNTDVWVAIYGPVFVSEGGR